MSVNKWLLVEWVDERNAFPSYGVVRTDALVNGDNDLHPGKMTFVRSKHGNSARRAQILRITDNKRQVKEHKILLERQNHQVQNMLTLCMRTIKEMKTDPLLYGSLNTSQQAQLGAGGSSSIKRDPMASDSSSDSEEEMPNSAQSPMPKLGPVKTPAQLKRVFDTYNGYAESTPVIPQAHQKRGPLVNSTAVNLKINGKQIIKLTLDQAMQTDDLPPQIPVEKIEEMEAVVTNLHTQFLNLVQRLQLDRQLFPIYPDEEHNRILADKNERNENVEGEEMNGQYYVNESTVETKENVKAQNSKSLHVRRVSAHTTNTEQDAHSRDGMVPIGSGNAVVPARLLKELNWSSYSSVTRRLLQAIFPRKVLATHSLTGKQSPAFSNKPAKKCLDPKLIDDIVDTVSERCGVPKRSVRNCITIKCTDEAKLYRNRMQGRALGRPGRPKVPADVEDRENLPLSPAMSRASSNGSG